MFTSQWLNVDCDEKWDLGTGPTTAQAERLGKGGCTCNTSCACVSLRLNMGRIMVWADVLHQYPKLVSELPDDVLLLDWEYAALEH